MAPRLPGAAVAGFASISATHHGFDGRDRVGTLIVNSDVATAMLAVLRRLYADGFPIRRMVPVDAYGGSDFRSIDADNTSAFNCRFVDGTTQVFAARLRPRDRRQPDREPYGRLGRHDRRIRASRPYVRRTPFRPGMAAEGHALVRAFDAIGWGWGGRWSGGPDYQHFSASGH